MTYGGENQKLSYQLNLNFMLDILPLPSRKTRILRHSREPKETPAANSSKKLDACLGKIIYLRKFIKAWLRFSDKTTIAQKAALEGRFYSLGISTRVREQVDDVDKLLLPSFACNPFTSQQQVHNPKKKI